LKKLEGSKGTNTDPNKPAPEHQAGKSAADTWLRQLNGLKQTDWLVAYQTGRRLAALPPEEGFAFLTEIWGKIGEVGTRQQLLKAWYGNHPRLLDALDLGMNDPSPQVQSWAQNYLQQLTLRDFTEDIQAYKQWRAATRGKPLAEVVVESVRQFVADIAKAEGKEAQKRAELFARNCSDVFYNVPAARNAAIDAGLVTIIERWVVASGERKAGRNSVQLAAEGLRALARLNAPEADLRRIAVPLLSKDRPVELRTAAVESLTRKDFPWATDVLIDALKRSLDEDDRNFRVVASPIAIALAEIGDPKVIPTMIAVVDADNTYDTVYGVGSFGLGRLTGVSYDQSHDGAWWHGWWEKNKERYPAAVQALEIPKFPKRARRTGTKAERNDPLADVADVSALDLRAGGDAKKRYSLIQREGAKTPPGGFKLLIILPGGDGSANFLPFVRRIHKNVLDEDWLIAQAVAPKWDARQFNQVVWPTDKTPYAAAKFSTEEFIEAIIADVRSRPATAKLDPKRIFLLGWSSGGPPCYAMMLRKATPVTGAFIAMSVFWPETILSLEDAKGKAFYLLQSPDDNVTPMRHAEAAEKALGKADAKVRLQRYDGGHGWHGDVWQMLGDGIEWLDRQAASTAATLGNPAAENKPQPRKWQGQILTYEADPKSMPPHIGRDECTALYRAIDRRLNPGTEKIARVNWNLFAAGTLQINVELSSRDNAARQRVERLLLHPGTLEFRVLANTHDNKDLIARAMKEPKKSDLLDPAGQRLAWWVPVKAGEERTFARYNDVARRTQKHGDNEITEVLVLADPYNVTGKYLTQAKAAADATGKPCVEFTLNDAGGKLFAKLTGDHLPGKETDSTCKLGIILDGQLHSAPAIRSTISNRGEISGVFTKQDVADLADILNSGPLSMRLKLVNP
jgi:predicted esterase